MLPKCWFLLPPTARVIGLGAERTQVSWIFTSTHSAPGDGRVRITASLPRLPRQADSSTPLGHVCLEYSVHLFRTRPLAFCVWVSHLSRACRDGNVQRPPAKVTDKAEAERKVHPKAAATQPLSQEFSVCSIRSRARSIRLL